jgi:anaerobic magnesium-protoporphyrin IX monomethyl ester cyclase
MSSILFSHSYFLRFDPKQWSTGQPYAPIGTLYAAGLLRENGYSVSFFDTMFAHSPREVLPALEEGPDYFVLYDDGFNYLTKMCLTNMREAAFEMIKLAKQNGCIVIVSSSDSTDQYEKYLEQGADFVMIGEAEMTLLELVQRIGSGETDHSVIQGLAFKQNDCVVKTPRRQVSRELDSLPLPAWDLVDIGPYRQMWMKHAGYFSLNVGTTRGCPFKCNWCAKPIYGNRYNSRSPQHVIKELLLLKEKFEFDHIWFCDDIFGLKPGWNYIRDLARAGCSTIWMGAESGSQKVLDAMDKGITVEQIHTATRLIRKHGMKPSFFIQFGYPGETKDDIVKTIKMITDLLPHEIGISVSYPLPGTQFYEKVKNDLKEKTNWTDSDELALMFRNTYEPAFYKRLHRYVHHEFRKHQGLDLLQKGFQKPFSLQAREWKKAVATGWYSYISYMDRIKLNRYARQ